MSDPKSKLSKKTILASIALHAILIAIVVFSYQPPSKPKPPVSQSTKPIVNAVAVDEKLLEQTISELKARKNKAENTARERLKKLEREEKALEAKRKKEEQRLAKLKSEQKKAKAKEAKRIKEEKARLAKLEADKKAAEKARQQEKARVARLKAEQEKLKKAREKEEQRLADMQKKRAAEEARKKAEIEKKQREAARLAALKAEQEAKRKEQQRLARIQSAKVQAEVDRYVALIRDRIEQQWRRPLQSQSELSCTLFVKLLPNGEVAYAEVRRSSGNSSFDDSALRAVYKASPLPIPNEGLAFEEFRELILPFQPEV